MKQQSLHGETVRVDRWVNKTMDFITGASILSPMSYHHFFKHYPALWETGMLLFFSHLWEIPKVSAAA